MHQDGLEEEAEWNVWLFIVDLFYMYILYKWHLFYHLHVHTV